MVGSLLFAACVIAQTLPPAGAPRDERDADLKSGTAIVSGRVTDAETGDPLARVTVSLTLPRYARAVGHQDQTQTAAFQFRRLPAGTYSVIGGSNQAADHASPCGIPDRDCGKSAWQCIRPLSLRDGEVFDKAYIALPRGLLSSARASIDEDGAPIADMLVNADAFDGRAGFQHGRAARTTAEPSGSGVTRREPTSVRDSPSSGPNRQEVEGFVRTCSSAATFPNGEAQPVRWSQRGPSGSRDPLRHSRLFRISGVVIDASGQPAPTPLFPSSFSTAVGTSGHNIQNDGGNFSVGGIAPGTYFIKAELPYAADPDDKTRPIRSTPW